MAADQNFDLSTEAIPASWHDAAAQAPSSSDGPLKKKKSARMRVMPVSDSLDVFTAILVATVTCLIGGYIWYELEKATGDFHPWLALVLGAAVAVAVRSGGGPRDHQLRGFLSLGIYFVALTAVLFILGRGNYIELYGTAPDFLDFEQHLYHSRLASLTSVTAWLSGALVAVALSYLTRARTG